LRAAHANILDLTDVAITELQKLSKANFDIDKIVTSAGELKFTRQIKRIINVSASIGLSGPFP